MDPNWPISLPIIAIAYRVWTWPKPSRTRDFFVVEYRTLEEGAESDVRSWSGATDFALVTLKMKGLQFQEPGQIVKGDQPIANRLLVPFGNFDAAMIYYENTCTYRPEPHYAACVSVFWHVHATTPEVAKKQVLSSQGLCLKSSTARRAEL